ncbi:unnamed protein product [Calypogeia fissa]
MGGWRTGRNGKEEFVESVAWTVVANDDPNTRSGTACITLLYVDFASTARRRNSRKIAEREDEAENCCQGNCLWLWLKDPHVFEKSETPVFFSSEWPAPAGGPECKTECNRGDRAPVGGPRRGRGQPPPASSFSWCLEKNECFQFRTTSACFE